MDLDYEAGLNIADGPWPRMREALTAREPYPWDILFALALCDARNGGGDPFWNAYARALLPSPASLTHPLCQPPHALAALQHARVADAAVAQQTRLATEFPSLTAAAETPGLRAAQGGDAHARSSAEHPTEAEWGLACVRSRAFQLAESRFAYVPFLDLANHAAEPNADFRAGGQSVELVAMRDLEAGDEVRCLCCASGDTCPWMRCTGLCLLSQQHTPKQAARSHLPQGAHC